MNDLRRGARQEKPRRAGRTKQEREQEFLQAIELLLGGKLMEWQKPILLEIRRSSLNGDPIDFSIIRRP